VQVKANPRSGLTDDQLATLRASLTKAKREIVERDGARRPIAEGDPIERGAPVGDAADQAEVTFEQSLAAELVETDRRRLQEIDDALARMEQGTYGICEGTSEPIGFDRLSAQPWSRYTSAYQEQLEAAAGHHHAPTL
jgi:DnaK suppressor protein